MNSMTYPGGRSITYSFNAAGRVSQIASSAPPAEGGQTQTIASNIAYHPFGGVKSYPLGNNQVYARAYDLVSPQRLVAPISGSHYHAACASSRSGPSGSSGRAVRDTLMLEAR